MWADTLCRHRIGNFRGVFNWESNFIADARALVIPPKRKDTGADYPSMGGSTGRSPRRTAGGMLSQSALSMEARFFDLRSEGPPSCGRRKLEYVHTNLVMAIRSSSNWREGSVFSPPTVGFINTSTQGRKKHDS
jgi:hypothetical protein